MTSLASKLADRLVDGTLTEADISAYQFFTHLCKSGELNQSEHIWLMAGVKLKESVEKVSDAIKEIKSQE